MTKRHKTTPLTQEQVRRAIIIDFEGPRVGLPTFVGIHMEYCLNQVGFEPTLASAFEASHIPLQDPHEWARDLGRLARREDRRILGFGPHEERMLAELGQPGLVHNILPALRPWRAHHFPEEHERVLRMREWRRRHGKFVGGAGNTLVDFARLAGRRVHRGYGRGRVTARLDAVMQGLRRAGCFAGLTPMQKRKWRQVLRHNDWDCVSTYELALRLVS